MLAQSDTIPKVSDGTGVYGEPYGSDLTFDKAGTLYDADCGSTAGIYTYPLANQKLSSGLQPSFYTDATIAQYGCVWSVAID